MSESHIEIIFLQGRVDAMSWAVYERPGWTSTI